MLNNEGERREGERAWRLKGEDKLACKDDASRARAVAAARPLRPPPLPPSLAPSHGLRTQPPLGNFRRCRECERVQALYAMGRVLLNVLFAILKLRACHANRLLDRVKSGIIDWGSFHATG